MMFDSKSGEYAVAEGCHFVVRNSQIDGFHAYSTDRAPIEHFVVKYKDYDRFVMDIWYSKGNRLTLTGFKDHLDRIFQPTEAVALVCTQSLDLGVKIESADGGLRVSDPVLGESFECKSLVDKTFIESIKKFKEVRKSYERTLKR